MRALSSTIATALWFFALPGLAADDTRAVEDFVAQSTVSAYAQLLALTSAIHTDFATCDSPAISQDHFTRAICGALATLGRGRQKEYKDRLVAQAQALGDTVAAVRAGTWGNGPLLAEAEMELGASCGRFSEKLATNPEAFLAPDGLAANAPVWPAPWINSTLGLALGKSTVVLPVGRENKLAGPLFESIIRSADTKSVFGYMEASGVSRPLPNNPLQTQRASQTVLVTLKTHGYFTGDRVRLMGLTGGSGLSADQLNGTFVITSVESAGAFRIHLPLAATSSSAIGGAEAQVVTMQDPFLGVLWNSANDGKRVVTGVATQGSEPYHYIVRPRKSDPRLSELCYDRMRETPAFESLNAAPEGGADSIVCR